MPDKTVIIEQPLTYLVQTVQTDQLSEQSTAEPGFPLAGQTFDVRHYNWGGLYQPQTTGQLLFLPDRGFLLQMRCEESHPVTRFVKPNDPVYTDSCMEAFIAFFPKSEQKGYINFEINANGALLCEYGTGRHDRRYLWEMGITPPIPTVTRTSKYWLIALLIPLGFIQAVYGQCSFNSGDRLKGNFFKVGDNDINRHFASFAPIQSPQPDFHRPECFADLQIVGIQVRCSLSLL